VNKERLMSSNFAEWNAAWHAVLKHLQRIDIEFGHGSLAANVTTRLVGTHRRTPASFSW
jgi:hypothetical protein